MLLSMQFPFADYRRFLHRPTGCISQPGWPAPTIRPDSPPPFVRGFGQIKQRALGGVESWGEGLICDAKNSIKWQTADVYKSHDGETLLPFEVVLRRLFFDGMAVGKYELGVATRGRTAFRLPQQEFLRLARWFVDHPVSVPSFDASQKMEKRKPAKLREIASGLRKHILLSTTRSSWLEKNQPRSWWIECGAPILFMHTRAPVEDLDFRSLPVPPIELDEWGITITCMLAWFVVPPLPFLIVRSEAKFDRTVTRQLRLSILRLHAEHECLRMVLLAIRTGKIQVKRGSYPTERLQWYLSEATRRLFQSETALERLCKKGRSKDNPDIAEVAYSLFGRIWPGKVDDLKRALDMLDMRRNVTNNLQRYCDRTLTIKEFIVGDKITTGPISNSNVNIKSDLQNVTQAVKASAMDDSTKAELGRLLQQLSSAIDKVPPEQTEDAGAVAIAAKELVSKAIQDKPNRKSLDISAKGMLEAAKGIASVVPITLEIAKTISNLITGTT